MKRIKKEINGFSLKSAPGPYLMLKLLRFGGRSLKEGKVERVIDTTFQTFQITIDSYHDDI